MLGFDTLDWANQEGTLANLNDVAAEEGWDAVVPEALQSFTKPRRRVDLGAGQRALDQLGLGEQGDPG